MNSQTIKNEINDMIQDKILFNYMFEYLEKCISEKQTFKYVRDNLQVLKLDKNLIIKMCQYVISKQ